MDKVLIVEDKLSMAEMLQMTLKAEGFEVSIATSVSSAIESLRSHSFDAVTSDFKLPDGTAIDVLTYIKDHYPMLPTIVMTAFGSIETAVQALKAGAYDFLTKPFDPEKLIVVLRRAISQRRLQKENQALKQEFDKFLAEPVVIGNSPAWQGVMQKALKVAPLKSTVLITGPSGSGKEVVARFIHHKSGRKTGPFIAVNCAAIPAELIESELFGHEKGSFSGAISLRYGKFELADKGTIFLDEIADMHKDLQAKILRVLQESEFQRVGGTKTIKTDVRVIAATNKDLQLAVKQGILREDLYYRLNVFPIEIPPLSKRKEDIPPLVKHFITVLSKEIGKPISSIEETAMQRLLQYDWKGNVRELKNAVERAIILCEGDVLTEGNFQIPCEDISFAQDDETLSLHERSAIVLQHAQRTMIQSALRLTGGNKSKTAEILKISYKTLLTKIKELGIEEPK